mmetsp:Transcript_10519/g.13009  ORF Transcript_10519/g.13009 Transcript_10519/m.13009 type:complete len:286 (-) Transcript_10519:44-901(-)
MAAVVGANRYGKACVRLLKVIKGDPQHSIVNYTVQVLLEGDFEESFTHADNSKVVPTDTTKNTIYCIAKKDFSSPEEYALILGSHFLEMYPQVKKIIVDVTETLWKRMVINGKEHDFSFEKPGGEERRVHLEKTRTSTSLSGGIANYIVLKTTDSGFQNFHQCKYTVLPEMTDRILATNVTSYWEYNQLEGVDFTKVHHGIKKIITEKFATEYSKSVQATLWMIAATAISDHKDIAKIKFSLPNLHHWEIDTSRFGLPNDHDIFVAVDEPRGLIEAEVRRADAKL